MLGVLAWSSSATSRPQCAAPRSPIDLAQRGPQASCSASVADTVHERLEYHETGQLQIARPALERRTSRGLEQLLRQRACLGPRSATTRANGRRHLPHLPPQRRTRHRRRLRSRHPNRHVVVLRGARKRGKLDTQAEVPNLDALSRSLVHEPCPRVSGFLTMCLLAFPSSSAVLSNIPSPNRSRHLP